MCEPGTEPLVQAMKNWNKFGNNWYATAFGDSSEGAEGLHCVRAGTRLRSLVCHEGEVAERVS